MGAIEIKSGGLIPRARSAARAGRLMILHKSRAKIRHSENATASPVKDLMMRPRALVQT